MWHGMLLVLLLCFLQVEARNTTQKEYRATLMKELIDIGVIATCVPRRFEHFVESFDFDTKKKWKARVRFLAIRYNCSNPSDHIPFESDNIRGYPLVVADSKLDEYSRSSYINQLHGMVRPKARLFVVDVDIKITSDALVNVLKYTFPGSIYFPVVWSKYSPKHVLRAQKERRHTILPFSIWEGYWRVNGYGMFAMHARDLPRFRMNESFVGWGGEDNDLYHRVRRDPNMTIVRKKEPGLIHAWHDKNCTEIAKDTKKYDDCQGSRAANLGYDSPPVSSIVVSLLTIMIMILLNVQVGFINDASSGRC
jgi:hypothetical protein